MVMMLLLLLLLSMVIVLYNYGFLHGYVTSCMLNIFSALPVRNI